MGVRLYVNNYSTKLTAQLLSGGVTANVTAGSGAALAGANGTDWFICTLRKMSGFKTVAQEIVKISNRSTDALTIVRAQEGTAALQFEIGDLLDVDITAASMTDPQVMAMNGTANFSLDSSGYPSIAILNNAVATPFGTAGFSGLIIVTETVASGHSAVLIVGAFTPVIVGQSGTIYTTVSGTPNKVNIYLDGSLHLNVENKFGSTININMMTLRNRAL